jgi:hypothetical protein
MDNFNHFLNFEGSLSIEQFGNGLTKYGEGKFYLDHGFVFIELEGYNNFNEITNRTEFTGIVEVKTPEIQKMFELVLLPNPAMDEFEVIINEQFKELDILLKKMQLGKELNQELKQEFETNKNKSLKL